MPTLPCLNAIKSLARTLFFLITTVLGGTWTRLDTLATHVRCLESTAFGMGVFANRHVRSQATFHKSWE